MREHECGARTYKQYRSHALPELSAHEFRVGKVLLRTIGPFRAPVRMLGQAPHMGEHKWQLRVYTVALSSLLDAGAFSRLVKAGSNPGASRHPTYFSPAKDETN